MVGAAPSNMMRRRLSSRYIGNNLNRFCPRPLEEGRSRIGADSSALQYVIASRKIMRVNHHHHHPLPRSRAFPQKINRVVGGRTMRRASRTIIYETRVNIGHYYYTVKYKNRKLTT